MSIKNILIITLLYITPLVSNAGDGPTSLGVVTMGMSKANYIKATGIKPVDCNKYKDRNGKTKRSKMKYLNPEKKTLCFGFSFRETGSQENITVKGVSYDVVEAGYSTSKFNKSIGNSTKAIFLKNRLISFEVYAPEVSVETLINKYGEPKLFDNRKIDICKNRLGNEFNNNVGKLDAVWVNSSVRAILRANTSSPRKTCTDGLTLRYYILEEPKKLKIIESAIAKYRAELSKKEMSDSPF